MVYVYHPCNLILVPFCFYKSYHYIIKQHLYIKIKYIPIKKTTTNFKYIPMKHNDSIRYIIKSVYRCISLCFNKICNSPWHCIVRFLQDVQCYTLPRFTYSLPHLFFSTRHLVAHLIIILYGIHVKRFPWSFQNQHSFTFLECSSAFRVMAWREIQHMDISLLWEHNAFTCDFNIMNYIILLLLLMAHQTCTLTGDLTLV